MTELTEHRLSEIRARCDAATPDVTVPEYGFSYEFVTVDAPGNNSGEPLASFLNMPDAVFFAAARQDIPDLLAERAALKAEIKRLREAQRPDVQTFAAAMEQVLRTHDDRPGWEHEDSAYLIDRLLEEIKELTDLWPAGIYRDSSDFVLSCNAEKAADTAHELVDIANFCMMLYCNILRKQPEATP